MTQKPRPTNTRKPEGWKKQAFVNPSYDKSLSIERRLGDFFGQYHIVLHGVGDETFCKEHKKEIIDFVKQLFADQRREWGKHPIAPNELVDFLKRLPSLLSPFQLANHLMERFEISLRDSHIDRESLKVKKALTEVAKKVREKP